VLRILRAVDQPVEVKAQAISALGRLGTRAAIDPLCELLERGLDPLRARSALALGQIALAAQADEAAARQAVGALTAALRRDELRAAAHEALARAGAVAVPQLAARLPAAVGDELGEICDLLGESGDARAIEPLLDELGRGRLPPPRVANALGQAARSRSSVPAPLLARASSTLAALLSDRDPLVRRAALKALSSLRDPRAASVLADAVGDPDKEVRAGAIAELGRLKAASALTVLLAALGKGPADTAPEVARALGELGDARASGALAAALEHSDERVRREAGDALARLGPAASRELPTLLRLARLLPTDRRAEAFVALGGVSRGRTDQTTRELCLSAAEREELPIALEAVSALAAMHDGAAAQRLARLVNGRDVDPALRRRATAALGDLGGAGVARALITLLDDDKDTWVRVEAAWALGKLRDPSAEASLVRALGGANSASLRAAAAGALATLGRQPQSLARLLDDGDPATRANAALALGSAAKPAIERLAANDPDRRVRAAAERALKPARAAGPDRDWIALHLVDFDGAPRGEVRYHLTLSDGRIKPGLADPRGRIREESLPSGTCMIDLLDEAPPAR
jgi:HEAT repeat protein